MKRILFFIVILISTKSFSEEIICHSKAGQMLTLNLSNTYLSKNKANDFDQINKQLNIRFLELCKSDKDSNEIVSEMYNHCFRLIKKNINDKELKSTIERVCENAYHAAMFYIDGYEKGTNEINETVCESESTTNAKLFEERIPAGIPEYSTRMLKRSR